MKDPVMKIHPSGGAGFIRSAVVRLAVSLRLRMLNPA